MAEQQRKSGTEKAQETLDKAKRKVEGLTARHQRAVDDEARLKAELEEAKAEQEYAASHPLLRQKEEQLPLGEASPTDVDD